MAPRQQRVSVKCVFDMTAAGDCQIPIQSTGASKAAVLQACAPLLRVFNDPFIKPKQNVPGRVVYKGTQQGGTGALVKLKDEDILLPNSKMHFKVPSNLLPGTIIADACAMLSAAAQHDAQQDAANEYYAVTHMENAVQEFKVFVVTNKWKVTGPQGSFARFIAEAQDPGPKQIQLHKLETAAEALELGSMEDMRKMVDNVSRSKARRSNAKSRSHLLTLAASALEHKKYIKQPPTWVQQHALQLLEKLPDLLEKIES